MKTISVPLQAKSYPIWIENELLKKLPELLRPMNRGQTWVIFSQDEIYQKHGYAIHEALKSADFNVEFITLPNGEEAKSFPAIQKALADILEVNGDRLSTFLALGGGVVGDVTGFLAAIFMRGVDYIQIPPSLLAMVDSSIGGKTGINISEGKNLVGAFWQPKAVIIDPEVLITLPKRELTSAMGEIIKYGAILDKELVYLMSENMNDLLDSNDSSLLLDIIIRCAQIKSNLIALDEREGDKRRLLNFGHTIGHALETYFDFDTLRHGEAIAYGMIGAGKLSIQNSNLSNENFVFLKETIKKLPLPILPPYDSNDIFKIMMNDKKVQSGNLYFILLEDIGRAMVQGNIDKKSIINVLEDL